MIRKYLVTDAKGKEVYLETFDENEAIKHYNARKKAMDCYLDETEVDYEDVQYMSDEERLAMYKAINRSEIDVHSDEFWDWVEMELDE